MNYWLTTHWPHREDNDGDSHANIYLPDGREGAGRDLRVGDHVLIYESRTGRTLERVVYTGEYQRERVKCKIGRMGIVTLGVVASPLREREIFRLKSMWMAAQFGGDGRQRQRGITPTVL